MYSIWDMHYFSKMQSPCKTRGGWTWGRASARRAHLQVCAPKQVLLPPMQLHFIASPGQFSEKPERSLPFQVEADQSCVPAVLGRSENFQCRAFPPFWEGANWPFREHLVTLRSGFCGSSSCSDPDIWGWDGCWRGRPGNIATHPPPAQGQGHLPPCPLHRSVTRNACRGNHVHASSFS